MYSITCTLEISSHQAVTSDYVYNVLQHLQDSYK